MENGQHPPRHVAVELVVARPEHQSVPGDQRCQLMIRGAHRDVERLEFVGTAYAAAVIVRHHGDGTVLQRRIERPFAGNEEIVAVDESEHGGQPRLTNW